MKKLNVAIVGCGFAGAASLRILAKERQLAITVFDPSTTACFLPLLPDVLSNTVPATAVLYDLADFIKKQGAVFRQTAVIRIDTELRTLYTADGQTAAYDYLLLCAGSQTTFYGNTELAKRSLKIDNVADIFNVQASVLDPAYEQIVINGGGYTGLETATNIRKLLKQQGQNKPITIIEYSEDILRPLPQWIKDRIYRELKAQKIDYRLQNSIQDYQERTVRLATQECFSQALLIWTAGVHTPEPLATLGLSQDNLGRLKTNSYLQAAPAIFVAGDCAAFLKNNSALRMSVRFAVDEGRCAARNILRQLKGRPLRPFKPFDPGFIVPLAQAQGCGLALGLKVSGRFAILLHYLLCIWLSFGLRNRLSLVRSLWHL
jgi:NADH dehydrogenase